MYPGGNHPKREKGENYKKMALMTSAQEADDLEKHGALGVESRHQLTLYR